MVCDVTRVSSTLLHSEGKVNTALFHFKLIRRSSLITDLKKLNIEDLCSIVYQNVDACRKMRDTLSSEAVILNVLRIQYTVRLIKPRTLSESFISRRDLKKKPV